LTKRQPGLLFIDIRKRVQDVRSGQIKQEEEEKKARRSEEVVFGSSLARFPTPFGLVGARKSEEADLCVDFSSK
jgi:hypothetical protein